MTAMSGRGGAALYTPEILALAVELADYPLSDELPLRGEARSRVCGSRVALGLATGADGSVAEAGARVTACAIGTVGIPLMRAGVPGLFTMNSPQTRDQASTALRANSLGIFKENGQTNANRMNPFSLLCPSESATR